MTNYVNMNCAIVWQKPIENKDISNFKKCYRYLDKTKII